MHNPCAQLSGPPDPACGSGGSGTDNGTDGSDKGAVTNAHEMTGPAELRWGPRPGAFAFGGVLLATGVLWMFVASNFGDRIVAGSVMAVVLLMMIVGFRLRDRLRASVGGLVVGGFGGRREIPWSRVRRVEVVGRKRLGAVNHSLEIDLDDDELLVFGRMDLGVDPADVATQLAALRTGGTA